VVETQSHLYGHVLMSSSYNLLVLYLYCNLFFIRDVHGEFGLINVHSFDALPAISSRKVGHFFCLENGNPAHVFAEAAL